MKKTNILKLFISALVIALLLGASFAASVSAEEPANEPKIVSQNIRYQGDFAMKASRIFVL